MFLSNTSLIIHGSIKELSKTFIINLWEDQKF